MKRNLFINVFVNLILVVLVASFSLVGFVGGTINVFNAKDPIYNGVSQNGVSLMINVYWGSEYIEEMLAIFQEYGVKTTFFVGGYWVAKETNLLAQIIADGHEVGNHGYFHKEMKNLDYQSNLDEIASCHNLVEKLFGINMTLFAPPSGSFGKNTTKAAENLGYTTILWSKDTIDWRDKDANLIYSRATKNVKGGDLILMHPTLCTVKALRKILTYYVDNGLTVIPVSQNLGQGV
ncbi:MAG: polysaccharide deacetylase family protein [Clostridia bacterium]|nr:polysaccharide deacetylase family protein [Clostridia bacterium]